MSLGWSDVFPALADMVPEEDYSPAGFRTMPCKICGAMVVYSGRGRHIEFHEALRIGPLYGWRPRDPQR